MPAAVVNFAPERGSVELRDVDPPEIGPKDSPANGTSSTITELMSGS